MATVRIEPSGIEITVETGESVMFAATRSGYWWPTVCGGLASCHVCAMQVMSGGAALSEPDEDELEYLEEIAQSRIPNAGDRRLACQATVVADADLVVEKRGVRQTQESAARG